MRYQKFTALLLMLIFIVVLLCSCLATPAAPSIEAAQPSAPTNTPAPSPSATQKPFLSTEEIEQHIVSFPALEYLPQSLYPEQTEEIHYIVIADHPDITLKICESFSRWIHESVKNLERMLQEEYSVDVAVLPTIEQPSWQLLSTVAFMYRQDKEQLARHFSRCITVSTQVVEQENKIDVSVNISANNDPSMLLEFVPIDETQDDIMRSVYLYCYLQTLYGDQFEPLKQSNIPTNNVTPLEVFPLQNTYEFWDGWLISRDGGKRMHTGTDILAPEGEKEIACVDSEVLSVGYNSGAGNYVVLRAADGTQYHYYHMVELSNYVQPGQQVLAGDVIGLVGSTGNSAANHLHFTVISSDGYYVNPYPMLEDVLKHQAAS